MTYPTVMVKFGIAGREVTTQAAVSGTLPRARQSAPFDCTGNTVLGAYFTSLCIGSLRLFRPSRIRAVTGPMPHLITFSRREFLSDLITGAM